MSRLILRRLAAMVGVLLVLSGAMFGLQRFTPADPIRTMIGAGASAEVVAAERERLGYDDSIVTQYTRYVSGAARGDLQMSLRTRREVSSDIATFLPATIELVAAALGLALVLGTIIGVLTALRVRGAGALRVTMIAGAAAPSFLIAQLGILLFYDRLGWLPATGRLSPESGPAPDGPTGFLTIDAISHGDLGLAFDAWMHLLMPATCLAIVPAVSIGRVLRSSLVSTLGADHIRTARSKGLREITVLGRHALRNSVGPALSMVGLQIGLMFAGVIVVEQIFAWPGIGSYIAASIPAADFPAIAGFTLVMGALYVAVNTAVDIMQALADPRIKLNA